MTLGQRITQYRKQLGVSQEELGARLGVSRQARQQMGDGRGHAGHGEPAGPGAGIRRFGGGAELGQAAAAVSHHPRRPSE